MLHLKPKLTSRQDRLKIKALEWPVRHDILSKGIKYRPAIFEIEYEASTAYVK